MEWEAEWAPDLVWMLWKRERESSIPTAGK